MHHILFKMNSTPGFLITMNVSHGSEIFMKRSEIFMKCSIVTGSITINFAGVSFCFLFTSNCHSFLQAQGWYQPPAATPTPPLPLHPQVQQPPHACPHTTCPPPPRSAEGQHNLEQFPSHLPGLQLPEMQTGLRSDPTPAACRDQHSHRGV